MRTLRDTYPAVRLAAKGAAKLGQVYLRRRRPFVANHLVTVRCNLACPFCYVSGPEQKEYNEENYPRHAEMNTAQMCAFYRQLVANDFRVLVIVGGEPLLREDLDEMLATCDGQIFSTVFTNGMLLEDRHELLRRASSVYVSLDAPDDEHDRLRARPGCFAHAMAGIDAIRTAQPRQRVALMMTVTDQNAHRVDDMLAFARRMQLPVGFQPPSYDGQFALADRPAEQCAERVPAPAVVAVAFRRIRAATAHQRITGSLAFFDHVIEDRATYACHYPAYVLGPVYPNGDVVGCTRKDVIGNVATTSVADVLESPAFRANAAAGPSCPVGCRDWGIHDISALHNHDLRAGDLRHLVRAFVA